MTFGSYLRLAAIGLAALAAVAAIASIGGNDAPMLALPNRIAVEVQPRSALDRALVRCAELGEPGGHDAACLKAWSENRHRFLGLRPNWPDEPDEPARSTPKPAAQPSRPSETNADAASSEVQ